MGESNQGDGYGPHLVKLSLAAAPLELQPDLRILMATVGQNISLSAPWWIFDDMAQQWFWRLTRMAVDGRNCHGPW